MMCFVAIVGCTRTESAIASFKLHNYAQENTTADILIKEQLWSPLDMVRVDQE